MSHIVTVKTQFKDGEILLNTLKKFNVCISSGERHSVTMFGSTVEADISFKLPGWRYPVAVDLKTGEVKFDNYGGSWGQIEEFDKVHQQYTLDVAEATQDVQQLIAQGWQTTQETQPNGDVHLVLYK